jgi:hypothetical protein
MRGRYLHSAPVRLEQALARLEGQAATSGNAREFFTHLSHTAPPSGDNTRRAAKRQQARNSSVL